MSNRRKDWKKNSKVGWWSLLKNTKKTLHPNNNSRKSIFPKKKKTSQHVKCHSISSRLKKCVTGNFAYFFSHFLLILLCVVDMSRNAYMRILFHFRYLLSTYAGTIVANYNIASFAIHFNTWYSFCFFALHPLSALLVLCYVFGKTF